MEILRTAENVALIKRLEEYATNLYLKDHDPVDDGLGQFIEGFIEGVFAQKEEGLI
jgi:hypothetical protein